MFNKLRVFVLSLPVLAVQSQATMFTSASAAASCQAVDHITGAVLVSESVVSSGPSSANIDGAPICADRDIFVPYMDLLGSASASTNAVSGTQSLDLAVSVTARGDIQPAGEVANDIDVSMDISVKAVAVQDLVITGGTGTGYFVGTAVLNTLDGFFPPANWNLEFNGTYPTLDEPLGGASMTSPFEFQFTFNKNIIVALEAWIDVHAPGDDAIHGVEATFSFGQILDMDRQPITTATIQLPQDFATLPLYDTPFAIATVNNPEPATLLLVSAALLGLGWRKWRGKRA